MSPVASYPGEWWLCYQTANYRSKALTYSMLAPEDRPATHARVMKIASKADSEKSTPRASTPQNASMPSLGAALEAATSNSSSSSGLAGDHKVAKFEDDYQDEDGMTSTSNATEEDGWDVVSRKKSKYCHMPTRRRSAGGDLTTTEPISLKTSSSDPFASGTTYRPGSAQEQAETKIQRKNAKKNEAKKAQREAEEADRVARLAQHRKGLER